MAEAARMFSLRRLERADNVERQELLTSLAHTRALIQQEMCIRDSSYTNEVKAGVLGVPQHLLDQFGAVSPEVARAMADGARRLLGCDIALSATGVAGPGKDEWDHEVGTAFVAISTAEGAHVRALNLGSRPVRARLRTQTAHHAFDLARRYLSGLPFED